MLVGSAGRDGHLTGQISFVGSAARFAVPEKIIGLTLFLDFFDRCTLTRLAASAVRQRKAG
jgi:hypothetical protein